jgi:hypothetical protein
VRRLATGVILLDQFDLACLSFSAGCTIGWLVKWYKKRKRNRGEDPIIGELKEKSPIITVSTDGKPLKPPLFRGGDELRRLKGISLAIKNKKLGKIITAIVNAREKQKKLLFLSKFFFVLNTLLSTSVGLRFALGGSVGYTQIILLYLPSTVGGFIMTQLMAYPVVGVLIPIAILAGRGIENIAGPYEECRWMCEAAAEYHNKQLMLEMKDLNSILEDTAAELQLPIDQVPLVCFEQPLSLVERYKLNSVIKSEEARKRVQYFSEFIKKIS